MGPAGRLPGPPLHVIAYTDGERWEGMVEAGTAPAGWPERTLYPRISAPFGPDVDAILGAVAAADAYGACLAFVSHLAEGAPGNGMTMADAYLGFAAKRDWYGARQVGLRLVDALADTPEESRVEAAVVAAAVAAAHFVVGDPNVAGLEGRVMDALRGLPQDDPDVACMTAFMSMAPGRGHDDPPWRTVDLMRAAMATLARQRPTYSGTVRALNARFSVIRSILETERPDETLRGDLDAVSVLLDSAVLGGVRATYHDRA